MDPELGYLFLGLFLITLAALVVSKFGQNTREFFLQQHINFLEDEIRVLLDMAEDEDEDESEDESENEPDEESSKAEKPKELEKP